MLPDADLDAALARCLRGAFLNSGQVCAAYTRFLVHRSSPMSSPNAAPSQSDIPPGQASAANSF
ncbi:aldehyde dehydrogenase family protein [Streptomyces europaeiscabiei]|uniref:Aldehyde dehydrogenase family protein n=1 Tax=Streptomyces europaeiscabiei TaxID=146819 RepID=A0AAJ2PVR6_9ACTN|nr:aldehyde dehydrogenase family protein [Streptomyces europaeiscabiei]MDX3134307.1 aldehyde dehydrogenase family protein [Streptomyces europaeiscabiei]